MTLKDPYSLEGKFDQHRQHIQKQRHYFANKVRLVKAMVFPVVMYGCEILIVKKAESRRIDAFELWCWRRLLGVPWTARRSNQSILKEISAGCSLEGLMLKLQILYFGHLMRRADSLEKTLMLGGIGSRRRSQGWDGWLTSLARWTWVWVISGSWWWTGSPGVLQFMGSQRVRHDWATELNWTYTTCWGFSTFLKPSNFLCGITFNNIQILQQYFNNFRCLCHCTCVKTFWRTLPVQLVGNLIWMLVVIVTCINNIVCLTPRARHARMRSQVGHRKHP